MVAHGGKSQLLDAREAASSRMRGSRVAEDLNSNQATDFAVPLGCQLLVDSSLKTPRPPRGKPLAKLESKVSKGKYSVLGSARTSVGPDASQGR